MDRNRQANIRQTVEALCHSLDSAWHHVVLLKSFRDAYQSSPKMNGLYGRVINQLWGALWDALFVRIGTYYEQTPGTNSIHSLIKQLRKAKDQKLTALAKTIEERLAVTESVTARSLRWRNEVVGHNSSSLDPDEFNREATVHIEDVELLLNQVEGIANLVAGAVLDSTYDVQHWNEAFSSEASAFLHLVENGLEPTPQ